ncbi:hypothetical protein [uncultured Sunxiuqinia sp.]|uniref:hypothetical protein n=1 Tax=uncultured Sunxiuqinia sp. TaxID=1573825 RepID=UPI0030DCCCA2
MAHLKPNHICALCRSLYCMPNDLLKRVEDHDAALPEIHPLQSLVREQVPLNTCEQLQELSVDQLKEVRSLIVKLKKTDHRAPDEMAD